MLNSPYALFWFRRDLRLEDNAGLYHALKENPAVLPLFIFDKNILDKLPDKHDRRVEFIHQAVLQLNSRLIALGSSILCIYHNPLEAFKEICNRYTITAVYTNHDYEPYARQRDEAVAGFLTQKGIVFKSYKDQCVFEKNEVLKGDGLPYTVFTPYSRKWKSRLTSFYHKPYPCENYFSSFAKTSALNIPSLEKMGFRKTDIVFQQPVIPDTEFLQTYALQRNYPAGSGTSRLSMHLRFGTISIRLLVNIALQGDETWLNELIWREFYMMILWHFPYVETRAFKPAYDRVVWRNNEKEFDLWCRGLTGFPIVDAGMRELNATGYMHNRVRMIVSSFLIKDLLIDWRWGEAYFAEKLNDFDLSANNGGWQWAASSGCDAAPYFRIFNPIEQQKKFDPEFEYVKKWVPQFGTGEYPAPMADHGMARRRALAAYKKALGGDSPTALFE